jgi:paraquat-inducible protein B
MADQQEVSDLKDLPEAESHDHLRVPRVSAIWLLPIVAAVLGLWIVYQDYAEKGPLVTIRFANAAGIEPKKTRVKYRDVDAGMVEEVRFSRDLSEVVIGVRLDKAFAGRITESTRFWVVRPRIEGLRISGLGTLISGAYLTMDLGEGGAEKRHFVGLEEPRSILSDVAGTFFRLQAPGLGSLASGSPIYFRQIAVGEVVNYRMASDHSHVEIDIFIRAPHDSQVRENSRFWNVSGVELDLSSKGLRLGVESLAALVAGGVAFRTPQTLEAGPRAAPGYRFTLFANADESGEEPITITQPYLLHFDDSLRGLTVGAPVEFRGLRVGTVTDIAFEGRAAEGPIRTAVQVALEPERVPMAVGADDVAFEVLSDQEKLRRVRLLIDRSVAAGMRARLETGNLLTGQLFVELDFIADAAPAEVGYDQAVPEIPTAPSTFRGIAQSLSRVLAKLEGLPLAEIGRHLEETAAGANRLVNNDDLSQAGVHLASALRRLDEVMAILQSETAPIASNLGQAALDARALLAATERAVRKAETTLASLDGLVSEDGSIGHEMLNMMMELSAAARSVRLMADYLERHPEALIKGKPRY